MYFISRWVRAYPLQQQQQQQHIQHVLPIYICIKYCILYVLVPTPCLFFPALSLSLTRLPSDVVRNLMQTCCISVCVSACRESSWENLNSYTSPQTESCSARKAYDRGDYLSDNMLHAYRI